MSEQSDRPGRYQRSFAGLVGAMLVLLVIVVAFVVFRGVFRTTPRFEPEPVDYLALVENLQQSGEHPVYPKELPEGWLVKDARYTGGDDPVWQLSMDTADGRFVAIRQEDDSAEDLAEEWLDADAEAGEKATVETDLGELWGTWSDEGGDLGYSIELPEPTAQTVLVYGSASADEQRELLVQLTARELVRPPS